MENDLRDGEDLGPALPGADAVIAWCGGWPSFHDSEVLELHLRRSGPSHLRVLWIPLHGEPTLPRQAVVTFELDGITDLDLTDFSSQNVISSLAVRRTPDGLLRLSMSPCYGIAGYITAETIKVILRPGSSTEE